MQPDITSIPAKKLVGMQTKMSLSDNKTTELWQRFMSRHREIKNALADVKYSVQVYDPEMDYDNFTPHTVFDKWATVEVSDYLDIPAGMEMLLLPGGMYAVFLYRGTPAAFHHMVQYIFGVWLPDSAYQLDGRPHFEVLDDRYRHDDPNSEEEVWVPVIEKTN